MQFSCPECGVFLNSEDGVPAYCKCDGMFKSPPVEDADDPRPAPERSFEAAPTSEPVAEEPPPEPPTPTAVATATPEPEEKPRRVRRSRAKPRGGRRGS